MAGKRKPYEFVVDENGCFNVTNIKRRISKGRQTISIQRFIYEECFGEIPKGKIVVGKCGNKKCINPEHFTLTTKTELNAETSKKYVARPIDFDIDPLTGCFNCNSHCADEYGYHLIMVNNKRYLLHRFVYEQMFGEIPEDLVVRHRCDNPHCINPEHLEVGTQYDNVQDMIKRGRLVALKGELNGFAKLTEEDVKYIKDALLRGETGVSLAKRFNVDPSTIYRIKKGKGWTHIS